MSRLKGFLFACVGLSLVVVPGCAKKKELPPRGNLIGSAEFSPHLQYEMQQQLEHDGKLLNLSDQCLQMVERTDGMKVVELSDAKCPANGALADALNIVASMKVYSETEPGEKTYLVMGSSSVLDQNTDVAILKNITSKDSKQSQYQIESLCQKSDVEDFSLNCSTEFNDRGGVKRVSYKKSRPANLVRRHQIQELYAADEKIRTDMKTMESTLSSKIDNTRLALEESIFLQGLALSLEDARIEGALNKAVETLNKKDQSLESSIASAKTTLETAIAAEKSAREGKDTELANSINGLNTTMTTLQNGISAHNTKLGELAGQIAGVASGIEKANASMAEKVEELKIEISNLEALDGLTPDQSTSLAALKSELGRIEAMINKDKILEKMMTELHGNLKKLLPEKPEAPPVPENVEETKTEKP